MIQKYTVTKDADRLAPKWLAVRIDSIKNKFVYVIRDGAMVLKGVRLGHEMAEVGDRVCFNGKRLYIERQVIQVSP